MRTTDVLPLCAVAIAVLPTAFAAPIDESIRHAITATIRWQAYWEGAESLGLNYRAGSQIEAILVRSKTHIYTFLAPIDLEIDVTTGPDGLVTAIGVTSLADETNAEAVASFLRAREATRSGCIGRMQDEPSSGEQRGEQTGKILPLARPCPPEEKIVGDEKFGFVLPELTTPAAIQNKTTPPDSEILVAAVASYLDARERYCGAMNASIPFYSDLDPRVYVFVQSRGDCPSGVATFSRSPHGKWEFGKFFVDVPKEQMSGIIAHIKSNTARTVHR